ncbi:MAG: DUF3300 domain-containing protein [Candidatus Sulfotelmatobacter sp.]
MKTKIYRTLLNAVVASAMALGAGTALRAQDASMDKPSPAVSAPADQGQSSELSASQYNAPQSNAAEPSATQDVAPPPPQDPGAPQNQAPAPGPGPAPNAQQYSPLSAEQLQQLVAPIALYPDALVAQVLSASAYPTQIVEADRFLKENPNLKGQELGAQVDRQDWDPSVKALCQFPSVLANLDRDLSWTQELGDANYNQSADVMQAIQTMRHKAQDAGNLRTTPQQRVYDQDNQVQIEPADPDVVYVPQYNPAYVYGYPVGLWPGFYPWWGFGGPYISFGFGFPIAPFFGFGWGWHGWGIGWGFHGGVFFGGHPYAFHSRGFYSRNAYFHGNYRGYSSYGRSGYGARGFAGRDGRGFSAPANRGYARPGGERGFTGNRGFAGNRGAVGNNRGYAGSGNRGFASRGPEVAHNGGFRGNSRASNGRGSAPHGGSSFSGGHGHSAGGHSSGGHSSGGHGHSGGGHSSGGHGGGGHGRGR